MKGRGSSTKIDEQYGQVRAGADMAPLPTEYHRGDANDTGAYLNPYGPLPVGDFRDPVRERGPKAFTDHRFEVFEREPALQSSFLRVGLEDNRTVPPWIHQEVSGCHDSNMKVTSIRLVRGFSWREAILERAVTRTVTDDAPGQTAAKSPE